VVLFASVPSLSWQSNDAQLDSKTRQSQNGRLRFPVSVFRFPFPPADRTNVGTSRVMYRSEMLRRELTLLAQRNGLEGTVRIGEHVVNLDVEQVRRKPRRVGLTLLSGSKHVLPRQGWGQANAQR
jgi:hypothetical protein